MQTLLDYSALLYIVGGELLLVCTAMFVSLHCVRS